MLLGRLLKSHRLEQKKSLRQLSSVIGIAHTTLDRFERGYKLESDQLLKILKWIAFSDSAKDKSRDA